MDNWQRDKYGCFMCSASVTVIFKAIFTTVKRESIEETDGPYESHMNLMQKRYPPLPLWMLLKSGTENGDRGAGNRERKTWKREGETGYGSLGPIAQFKMANNNCG